MPMTPKEKLHQEAEAAAQFLRQVVTDAKTHHDKVMAIRYIKLFDQKSQDPQPDLSTFIEECTAMLDDSIKDLPSIN